MDFNFKKFEGRNVKLVDKITVTKSNFIGFPKKFYDDNGIEKYKYVTLFWDAGNKAIGVHLTNEKDKNNFTILHSKQGYGASIVARSFFRTYGIDTQKYCGRYDWKKEHIADIGMVYVIQLKNKA